MATDSLNCQLLSSIQNAFIGCDGSNFSADYKTQLLSNDPRTGIRVLSTISDDLQRCDRYDISVAFVTKSGVTPLKQILEEIDNKGVKGRILTTDYLYFTEPSVLRSLNQLKNVEIRMYRCKSGDGFHTKGYIFSSTDIVRIILGSSNWTGPALTTNREWNARVVSRDTGTFAIELQNEFESLWNSENTEKFEDFIDDYEGIYKVAHETQLRKQSEPPALITPKLQPNTMQKAFVKNVLKLYEEQEKKALLISATGTGKTYAAAFAIRRLAPRRMLFVVHREQICKQALTSFQKVIGAGKSYGIYSGSLKDFNADYVFSTIQTMSKTDNLEQFPQNEFDIIVIDEVHRAGAKSYQRLMEYFKPKFWLGMTASPDRTDGYDIYGLFDHNIAYEIRLQTALSENLLCPFHYFGVTDIEVNGVSIEDERAFSYLTSQERVDHILDRAQYFGYSGDRVKGLIFCSRKEECQELSRLFNERGLKTAALSGDTPQSKREDAINQLTNGLGEDRLDYIFTVDIFNEGVDIPEVNQVILLRPTESPIVFIQQLGRGLRKSEGKEFVVVIDFISNYRNNYLIPIALSGDNSYDKDNMRRFLQVDRKHLPGASTISFDKIAIDNIFKSIDAANTYDLRLLKQSYSTLKFKLGRIPSLKDFEEHDAIEVTKFFDVKSKLGSYYHFLVKYDKDYDIRLSDRAANIIKYLSMRLGHAKRVSEVLAIETLLSDTNNIKPELTKKISADNLSVSAAAINSIKLFLQSNFWKTAGEKAKNADCILLNTDGDEWRISDEFKREVEKDPNFRSMIFELIDFVKHRYEANFSNRYKDTDFVLYKKYTYEDVCRLLNWRKNITSLNIGGYFYDSESKTLPVFINYHKDSEAIAYEDRFISPRRLIALSKTKRSVSSPDADHIYKRTKEDKENKIYLFVRKNKDDNDAKAFYFLGEIQAIGSPISVTLPGEVQAFEIEYELEQPVNADLYNYITEG